MSQILLLFTLLPRQTKYSFSSCISILGLVSPFRDTAMYNTSHCLKFFTFFCFNFYYILLSSSSCGWQVVMKEKTPTLNPAAVTANTCLSTLCYSLYSR